ncbi:uncharacterized protein A4U43_C03F3630 [Asparagus officinalis]|uniref:Putative E3 ubiquitin-protein ligase LIN ARM-like domain-containing protein n=1 Tax=Asparagus officinalis TaxID=4686 RepID=A0A5P1FC93_ASPOF|nr:uncharacterized protein A4U43_C03F3630 [Asparagus officinalis]
MGMVKSCLVAATWLIHMLSSLPQTGVKMIASRCLLDQFTEVLCSSRNFEEKILATLALKSFIEVLCSSRNFEEKILATLALKSFISDPVSGITHMEFLGYNDIPSVAKSFMFQTEFWSCTELFDIDCTSNGEVWDAGRRGLRPVQEIEEDVAFADSPDPHRPAEDVAFAVVRFFQRGGIVRNVVRWSIQNLL